jgi:hypothetical protein
LLVIPAKAGIWRLFSLSAQSPLAARDQFQEKEEQRRWIPAFAGMTIKRTQVALRRTFL